jgi:small subunit ribosomal protein S20
VPNKVSARKRVRQNAKRRVHNRAIRSEMRSVVRKAAVAVAENQTDLAPAAIVAAQSTLAKAAKRNLIKKNTMSRKTSRLMKAANRAKAAQA